MQRIDTQAAIQEKLNDLSKMVDEKLIQECEKKGTPSNFIELTAELAKLNPNLKNILEVLRGTLGKIKDLGVIAMSRGFKKPTDDKIQARKNIQAAISQIITVYLPAQIAGSVHSDSVAQIKRVMPHFDRMRELLKSEFPTHQDAEWEIPNAGLTSDDQLYAKPRKPLSKKQFSDYLKVLQAKNYNVVPNEAECTLCVYDIHTPPSARKESKQEVRVKTILEFPNPEKLWISEGWDKTPYEVTTTVFKPQWNESVVVERELTEQELKSLPSVVSPIEENELHRAWAESRQILSKVTFPLLDSVRGRAPRVDGHVIKAGQCIAIGGGYYGYKELSHDYAFGLWNEGKVIIKYSPQNLPGLLMHAAYRVKPQNSEHASCFEQEDLDQSVKQDELNDCNIRVHWWIYQKKYALATFVASRDISNEYLCTSYGVSWWECRNIVPDFFYKRGPMLDAKLHRRKIEIHLYHHEDGRMNEVHAREFEREDLMRKAKRDDYEIGMLSEAKKGVILSNKAILKALTTPLRPHCIILPEAAIEYCFQLDDSGHKTRIVDNNTVIAKKLREATADNKMDEKEYTKLVNLAKEAKRLDAPSTNGYTALHWAIEKDNKTKIRILLDAGAKRDYKLHSSFKSPAELAKIKGIDLDAILKADSSSFKIAAKTQKLSN